MRTVNVNPAISISAKDSGFITATNAQFDIGFPLGLPPGVANHTHRARIEEPQKPDTYSKDTLQKYNVKAAIAFHARFP